MRRSDWTPFEVASWTSPPLPWNTISAGGCPCSVMSGTGWRNDAGSFPVGGTPGRYPAVSSSAARYFTARSAPTLPGLRPSSRSSERNRIGPEIDAGVMRAIAARSPGLNFDVCVRAVCAVAGVAGGGGGGGEKKKEGGGGGGGG